MLAERGDRRDLDRLAAAGYVFDLKIDGIRALVSLRGPAPRRSSSANVRVGGSVVGGDDAAEPAVAMTSRNGLDLTGRYPELVETLRQVAAGLAARAMPGDLVLDAEIAVPGPDGLPSWPLTHRRTAQRTATAGHVVDLPAMLYVFDLLELAGEDTTGWPLRRRRAALDELAASWPQRITLTPTSSEPQPLWDLVLDHDLEGVIAKNPDSRYSGGRSRHWVKIKATKTLSCLVGGVEWAPDLPTEPRSLQLFLVGPDGELVACGKASAGVGPALRPALLDGLRRPPLIVEVEYSQITSAGVLRHPVVRAVRRDIDVLGCSTDQLRGATAR